jgi:ribonucleoside-diphosphate reductase alpha chain
MSPGTRATSPSGCYDEGQPGELFITMAKEGSTIGGLMDSLGTATSVALQYGVPLESMVRKFTHQRFEPAGMTTNADIPFAKSLVDYIFRWMGMQFIPGYREANAPKRPARAADAADSNPTGPDRITTQGDRAWIASSETSTPTNAETEPRAGVTHPVITAGTPSRTGDSGDGTRPSPETGPTGSALSDALGDAMGDAPPCEVCGTITVRNGTCYRCLNCGHSMGCS